MKLLSIHVEKNLLRMALVDHKSNHSSIEKIRSFDLPDDLADNKFIEDPVSLANFISNSINKSNVGYKKVTVIFGSDLVIHREYTHALGKKSQIMAIADTEAESILPNDDFIVENFTYNNTVTTKDMGVSSIYAIPDSFTLEFVNALKRTGIKVLSVTSVLNAYQAVAAKLLKSCPLNDCFPGETIAFIDISCDEIRIAVFNKGLLLHQRLDEQYMEEACKVASESFRIPIASVRSLINTGEMKEDEEGLEELQGSLRTAFSRLMRSLNVSLNEFNLSLDGIIATGDGSNIPMLADLIEDVSGVKAFLASDLYEKFSSMISLTGELEARPDLYQNILLLAGIDSKGLKSVNFILRGLKRKRSKRTTIAVSAGLVILTLIVMSLQPINLLLTTKDKNKELQILASPEYMEVQALLDERRALQNELLSVESRMSALPFGRSDVALDLIGLRDTMFSEAKLENLVYNVYEGRYQGVVSFSSPDVFLKAKNRVNLRDDFRLDYPLSIAELENEWFGQFEVKTNKAKGDMKDEE